MVAVWVRDLVVAARSLRQNLAVSVPAAITLTFGIAGATAVFAIVEAVLWRPLPYDEPSRLVALFRHDRDRGETRNPTTAADFDDWRRTESLRDVTAARPYDPMLDRDGVIVRVEGLKATESLFTLLGVEPFLGRFFTRDDDERVVVLSHALWRRELGGEPSWMGRSIRLDGEEYLVLGVMPPEFFFPPFWATDAEFWAPLRFSEEAQANRGSQFLRVFARLAPRRTIEEARAELDVLARRLETLYPDTNTHAGINIEPLREPAVGGRRMAYGVLLGAVGWVLVIACANVANLLLARSLGREREMAIRLALGANRRHLVRQVFTESLVLSSFSTLAALALAATFFGGSPRLTQVTPFPTEIRLDPVVFGFALAVCVAAAVLFGAAPALQAGRSRFDLRLRGALSRRDASLRSGLVVAEVALALALLIVAGAFLRSFVHLSRFDPGFRRDNLLTWEISLTGTSHTEPERQRVLIDSVLERIRSDASVSEASFVNHLPIGGDLWRIPFSVDGLPEDARAAHRTVSPGYFRTLGIPILAGRGFDESDRDDTAPVVVINQTLAERTFVGESPIGREITIGTSDRATVVGVAGDARQWALTDPVRPEIYFPYNQNPSDWWHQTTLVVRSDVAPDRLEPRLRAAIAELDPRLPVTQGRTFESILSSSLAEPRLHFVLMALFALIGLALSVAGVYGVIAFAAQRRRREIGLRMALGASPGTIRKMVLGNGLVLTGAGVLIGTVVAAATGQALEGLAHGVSVVDPTTILLAAALVLTVGAVASAVPAWQASARPPIETLRED
ncbi:MAG TPA: ABC transporter permease [Vicinamibacteria bacterium]|nr:ABC transporter permease [Vicinamibacteria bacterium]